MRLLLLLLSTSLSLLAMPSVQSKLAVASQSSWTSPAANDPLRPTDKRVHACCLQFTRAAADSQTPFASQKQRALRAGTDGFGPFQRPGDRFSGADVWYALHRGVSASLTTRNKLACLFGLVAN